jgi:hypothetical protein
VQHGAQWYIAERQGVAHQNVGLFARHYHAPHFEAVRGQDVPLFAIGIEKQGYAGGAVWVIFYGGHFRGDVGFVPFEVYYPILPFVAAANVAAGYAACIGPTARAVQLFDQGAMGLRRGYFLEALLGHAALPWRRGVEELYAH